LATATRKPYSFNKYASRRWICELSRSEQWQLTCCFLIGVEVELGFCRGREGIFRLGNCNYGETNCTRPRVLRLPGNGVRSRMPERATGGEDFASGAGSNG
jgi:hypothetical protein